jgi:LmbE family N-acetylglucosaminyl deacetylase
MHQKWGNLTDAVATRRQEDRNALVILGAEGRYLPFHDCIYRGASPAGPWYYNADTDLFGQLHPADLALADEIAQSVAELISKPEESLIYAPLGVGHHVDHQLTHTAAWELHAQGYAVLFYEDYPYVDPASPFTHFGKRYRYNLAAALAEPRPAGLQPQLYPFSEDDLQAKIKSVAAYASQISSLFVDEAAIADNLRNYALSLSEGTLAERFWLIEEP